MKPALLIADEPTTALDAVIQRDVMELMVELTRAEGTAVLLISHDLPMVARYTSRIVVMEKGAIVEKGRTEDLLKAPQHPYTKKLLSSLPFRGRPRQIDLTSVPMISARDIIVDYAGRKSLFRKNKPKRALHGVSIDIHEGEVVALVGGSGSGRRRSAAPLPVSSRKARAASGSRDGRALKTGPIIASTARWCSRILIHRSIRA